MAQANSLSPIGISAVKILARLAAKRAVQENLRAQGVRVSLFPHAELMRQAAEYLSSHPDLYQQALERAQRMIAEGVFGKRAQRAWFANLINSVQSQEPCSDKTIAVQKLGAE